jgi:hypothetical protein
VTVVTQALCNQAPAPPTMKATMNQNKIQDQSLEIENLSAIQWVSSLSAFACSYDFFPTLISPTS